VFLLTGLGGLLVSLDVSIANSLLPAIGAGFHTADRAALSWIITGYAIVFAAMLLPAGRLAEGAGRRGVYLGGLVTFGAGSALCGRRAESGLVAFRSGIAGRQGRGRLSRVARTPARGL
jgi:MFS family permease